MKNWHLNGKSYTKREFAELLKKEGQTIPYEKTRKTYQQETDKAEATIYCRGQYLYAVV